MTETTTCNDCNGTGLNQKDFALLCTTCKGSGVAIVEDTTAVVEEPMPNGFPIRTPEAEPVEEPTVAELPKEVAAGGLEVSPVEVPAEPIQTVEPIAVAAPVVVAPVIEPTPAIAAVEPIVLQPIAVATAPTPEEVAAAATQADGRITVS